MWRLIALLFVLGTTAIHAEPLRITTWNLGFSPQESVWAEDGERVARVASVLRSLDADVILLQAVPDRQTCETLAGLLAPGHYQVAACSAFTNSSGRNLPQVAILSKQPVAASWTEPWKPERSIVAPGGLSGAAIRFGAGLVVVYCVQLKDNVLREEPEQDTQLNILEREFSAAQLAQHTATIDARLTNHAAAIIVAGTLNTNPDEARFVSENTLRLLEEAGFKNAFNDAPWERRITHPGGGSDPDATADYVFARGANFLGRPGMLMSGLSGHLPVTCDLVVPVPVPVSTGPPEGRVTIRWPWLATLPAALLLLFVGWWFGTRKRFYSPAQLRDTHIEGLLSFPDEGLDPRAATGFAAESETAVSATPVQSPDADPTRSRIQSLERRAVAAERRAARATEVVRLGLVPHLARLMKDILFRGVATQRTHLLETQEAGAVQVAELERRLVRVQTRLQGRLTAYERRIAELEKEIAAKDQANRELLAARKPMMKQAQEAAFVREEETQVGSDAEMK